MNNLFTESKYELSTTFEKGERGCELISNKIYQGWCKKANDTLKDSSNGYLEIVKTQVEEFKPFIKKYNIEKFKEHIKEFDEQDSFFKENLANVNILKENLKYCNKASKKIDKFIDTKIKPNFLLVYFENTESIYDIINKFNTNYTAIAYLLTKIIELRTDDDGSTKFIEVFNNYFIKKSADGESEFYKDLLNYLERNGPDLNKKFDGVIHTIRETSRVGLETEIDFIEVLAKHKRTYNAFAGDFSFNDLMGVDLFLELKDEQKRWVPVQVKTNRKDCRNNYRFCKNICVARNGENKWIGYIYDGNSNVPTSTLTF